jgi:hypothetical protein
MAGSPDFALAAVLTKVQTARIQRAYRLQQLSSLASFHSSTTAAPMRFLELFQCRSLDRIFASISSEDL